MANLEKPDTDTLFVRSIPGWLSGAIEKFREQRRATRGKRPSKADAVRELLVAGLHQHGIQEEKPRGDDAQT